MQSKFSNKGKVAFDEKRNFSVFCWNFMWYNLPDGRVSAKILTVS